MLGRAARPWLIKLLMPALPFRNLAIAEATYYAKNLGTNMPPLLLKSREIKDALLAYAYGDRDDARAIIATRIAAYAMRLDQLEGSPSAKTFTYFEELSSYWAPLRFGARDATLVGATACRARISDAAMFGPVEQPLFTRRPGPPGLLIDIPCGDDANTRIVLRVVPTRLEQDCFRASVGNAAAVGSAANPLRTSVRVQVDYAERTPASQAVLDIIYRTPTLAASLEVLAVLTVDGDLFRIVGKEVAIEWRAERADAAISARAS
jgi:hypothetical protein